MWTSPAHAGRRAWIAVILSVLMLGALGLRLHVVWQRLSKVSDEPAVCLVGDEIGFEALADALLHGSCFPSPVRGPVYPMFIAAVYAVLGERSPAKLLYVQAFIGVTAVPLTYLLVRRVTGIIPALVAAGIVAGDAALIEHASLIYSKIMSDFSVVLFRPNFMLASEEHPMKTHKNQWLSNLLFPLLPSAEPRTRAHTMVSGVQTPSQ
jgi:hypothetical protein